MSSNFLIFDENEQNMLSDGDYNSSTQRQDGVVPGLAQSALHNKLFFQTSTMCAALAEVLSNQGNTVQDSDYSGLVDALTAALAPPTGLMLDYVGVTAPSGYVLADGKTIGSAASSATELASADTEALFTLLWNSMTNTEAPVSGGRGGSAAADFAANKTITLPDMRGRTAIALDNLGGSAANRITNASTNGTNSQTLGAAGGSQTTTLSNANLPTTISSTAGTSAVASGSDATVLTAGTSGASFLNNSSGGTATSVTQPWMALTKIIKL